jgi:hypothetical protein
MLTILFLVAAPAPPPPVLTAELLVGRWSYDWATMTGGWIVFMADGRYAASHDGCDMPKYAGLWEYRRGVLTLHETRVNPEDGSLDENVREYAVAVSARKWPVVLGDYHGTVVVLSNPRRSP